MSSRKKSIYALLMCLERKEQEYLQQSFWQCRDTSRRILSFLPMTLKNIFDKVKKIEGDGLVKLPKSFRNKRIRLWYLLCYRKELFDKNLFYFMECSKELTKIIEDITEDKRCRDSYYCKNKTYQEIYKSLQLPYIHRFLIDYI